MRSSIQRGVMLLAAGAVALGGTALLSPIQVHAAAATYYVGSQADLAVSVCVPVTSTPPSLADQVANAACSLRHAVSTAAAGDTVLLPTAGPYILNDSNALVINDAHAVTIIGPSGGATIQGQDSSYNSRLISVNLSTGSAALTDVTLAGVSGTSVQGQDGAGMAVTGGTIALSNVIIKNTTSLNADGQHGFGGCMFVAFGASVHATNLTMNGCTADGAGGGLASYGNVTIHGGSATGNAARDLSYRANGKCGLGGGGIFNAGTLALTGYTLSNNTSAGNGGGILNSPIDAATIFQGDVINGNTASGESLIQDGGGGVYDSPGGQSDCLPALIGARPAARHPDAATPATASWTDIVLDGNTASRMSGGGVYSDAAIGAGSTSWDRLQVSNNSAASEGGGMYISGASNTLVRNATITANTAPNAGGLGVGRVVGLVSLVNDTISQNTAAFIGAPFPPGVDGGGLNVDAFDRASITNTVVSDNHARTGSTTTLSDCSIDSAATYTNLGHNLVGPDCKPVSSDIVTDSPALQPLANNGYAFSKTLALTATSPEVDHATSVGCPAVDQRLVTRPQGAACDIGAFEFVPPVIPVPPTGASQGGGPAPLLLVLLGLVGLGAARIRRTASV